MIQICHPCMNDEWICREIERDTGVTVTSKKYGGVMVYIGKWYGMYVMVCMYLQIFERGTWGVTIC